MSLDSHDKQWISEQLEHMSEQLKHYVDERCEQVETKLLTEFHKWASPADMRARSHSAAIHAIG